MGKTGYGFKSFEGQHQLDSNEKSTVQHSFVKDEMNRDI